MDATTALLGFWRCSGTPYTITFDQRLLNYRMFGSLSRRFSVFVVAFVNDGTYDDVGDANGSGVVSGCRRTPYTMSFAERFSSYEL